MFIPPSWSHVQDDLTQVGVGLHVLVRGLRLLEPVLGYGIGVGFGLGSGFGLRPERFRVRVRVKTLTLTRTLNANRNPNLLEPVELAVDDDGKVATWGATVRAPYSYGTARSRLVRGPGTHGACVAGQLPCAFWYIQGAEGWYAWPVRTVRRPQGIRVSLGRRQGAAVRAPRSRARARA